MLGLVLSQFYLILASELYLILSSKLYLKNDSDNIFTRILSSKSYKLFISVWYCCGIGSALSSMACRLFNHETQLVLVLSSRKSLCMSSWCNAEKWQYRTGLLVVVDTGPHWIG